MSILAALKRFFLGDPSTWTSNYSTMMANAEQLAHAPTYKCVYDWTDLEKACFPKQYAVHRRAAERATERWQDSEGLKAYEESRAERLKDDELEPLPQMGLGIKRSRKPAKRKPAKSAVTPAKRRKPRKSLPVKPQRVPKGAKQRKRGKA